MDIKAQLINRLDYVDATRHARNVVAQEVLRNPEVFNPLLEIALTEPGPKGHRACWIVEFVCKKELRLIAPHLTYWISKLPHLKEESAIRPMAKICEMLCEYHEKSQEPFMTWTKAVRENMIEVCFDWLIGPHKVAPKAFSMRCLFLLGKQVDWVHEELRHTLLRDFPKGSAAYKSRARHLLEKLEKSA